MSAKTLTKLTLLLVAIGLLYIGGALDPDGGCPPRTDGKPITDTRRCM